MRGWWHQMTNPNNPNEGNGDELNDEQKQRMEFLGHMRGLPISDMIFNMISQAADVEGSAYKMLALNNKFTEAWLKYVLEAKWLEDPVTKQYNLVFFLRKRPAEESKAFIARLLKEFGHGEPGSGSNSGLGN